MNSVIIEKLKKILARSTEGSGASEAEMQTAMAMAQKLAVENNIDLASISSTAQDGNEIEVERVELSSNRSDRQRPHHDSIHTVLQNCFDVRVIYFGMHTSRFVLVGEKTDVALATFCFHWLDKAYLNLFRKWDEANPRGSYDSDAVRRRSYYQGLGWGIISNNKRAKEEAVKTATVSGEASVSADSYALVLVNKKEAVEAKVEEEFPDLRKTKPRDLEIDYTARSAGHERGQKIKLSAQLA